VVKGRPPRLRTNHPTPTKLKTVNYRKLGNTGLLVSEIGLGCNNFGMRIDLDGTRKVVARALDLGVTFFDTADNYGNFGGSETLLGEVLGAGRRNIVLRPSSARPWPRAPPARMLRGPTS
jgi:aryl-alcohol dehydrogenase-like predicted oxidoreductase